jgi:hypothetical protein
LLLKIQRREKGERRERGEMEEEEGLEMDWSGASEVFSTQRVAS